MKTKQRLTKIGFVIPQLMRQALKEEKFEKLMGEAKTTHGSEYTKKVKNTLIEQWEKETGQVWPVYKENLYDKRGNILAESGAKLRIHHIIPQQIGGPHKWWNIYPLDIPNHQLGIHLSKSALSKILKDTQK